MKKFSKLSLVCDTPEGFRLIVSLDKTGKVETSYFNFDDKKPFIHPKKFKLEKEKLKEFLEMIDSLNVFNLEDKYEFMFGGEIIFYFGKEIKKIVFENNKKFVMDERLNELFEMLVDLV